MRSTECHSSWCVVADLSDWQSLSSVDQSAPPPPPSGPSELRRGDRGLWTCPAAAEVAAVAGGRLPRRPVVRWTRDGVDVAAADGVGRHRVTLHEDGALEVDDVRPSDAGRYKCGVVVRTSGATGGDSENEATWSDEALTVNVVEHSADRKNQ